MRHLEERGEEGTQNLGQPAQEQAEVVAGGGEGSVGAITLMPLELKDAQEIARRKASNKPKKAPC